MTGWFSTMSSLILEGKFGGEQLLPISYSASPMTLTESVQTLAKLDFKKNSFLAEKAHLETGFLS